MTQNNWGRELGYKLGRAVRKLLVCSLLSSCQCNRVGCSCQHNRVESDCQHSCVGCSCQRSCMGCGCQCSCVGVGWGCQWSCVGCSSLLFSLFSSPQSSDISVLHTENTLMMNVLLLLHYLPSLLARCCGEWRQGAYVSYPSWVSGLEWQLFIQRWAHCEMLRENGTNASDWWEEARAASLQVHEQGVCNREDFLEMVCVAGPSDLGEQFPKDSWDYTFLCI